MSTHPPLALVTGATRGIGAEVARQLGAAGYRIVVTGRDVETAREHARALVDDGSDAEAEHLDIDDSSSISALAATLADRPLDVLVNNAAAFGDWSETASTADLDDARRMLETNLFGTWRVIQALLPALRRADHGRIVNVGSGAGSHGAADFGLATNPGSAGYAISKAALHALTAKLAVELADDGIRVNAVDPGLTATAPGMEAMGARPVVDGATGIVSVALRGPDGPTGTLTRDGEPLPW